MTNEQIKDSLLKAGVKNLKEFGYPFVTTESILTDEVYSLYFKNMLIENKSNSPIIDETIEQLLKEIK